MSFQTYRIMHPGTLGGALLQRARDHLIPFGPGRDVAAQAASRYNQDKYWPEIERRLRRGEVPEVVTYQDGTSRIVNSRMPARKRTFLDTTHGGGFDQAYQMRPPQPSFRVAARRRSRQNTMRSRLASALHQMIFRSAPLRRPAPRFNRRTRRRVYGRRRY